MRADNSWYNFEKIVLISIINTSAKMKISNLPPPNFETIKAKFPISDGVIFTWGDTIHNPFGAHLTPELIHHEETHEMQQKNMTPEGWWAKFIIDTDFRFRQELEAYQRQYKFYCQSVKDRNAQARYLFIISRILASELYGNCVKQSEAQRLIRQ